MLRMEVINAVARMEILKEDSDRQCVFNEYSELIAEKIDNEILAIPTKATQYELDK